MAMTPNTVVESLDRADEALARLAESCCQPNRSPRMARLSVTLGTARAHWSSAEGATDAKEVIESLADAGAQIGELQVECCALSRMPLYSEMLVELTKAQRAVKGAYKLGH